MTTKSRANKANCERTEPVMVWALRANERRRPIHISDLQAHENGRACGCVCYACGDKLRAINLDKPNAHFELKRTQQRHFKHDHSAGDRNCMSAVAKLVALAHFVEQEEVFLPPSLRPGSRTLASGLVIEADTAAPARTVKVLERHWIDEQSAILLLDDGTELAVTVRTSHTICEDGTSRAVLSLAGLKNPDVAGWTKEEIIEHLRLPGWMKWERHWSDDQLGAQAKQALDDKESEILGDIPREWLEGLSGKMANETILHWVIKRTIERRKMLKVPEIVIPRSLRMPNGDMAHDVARRAEHTLLIDKVTFERKIGDVVPDVVCWASKMGGNSAPFQLLIEAAVTHYIDEAKRKKIADAGIACIQIRADLFRRAGYVAVNEIERQVAADAGVKEWILPPDMSPEIKLADTRLARKAREIEIRLNEEQREREQRASDQRKLNAWYRNSTDKALAAGYLKALTAAWRGEAPPMVGTAEVELEAMWQVLVSRNLVKGPRNLAESKDGPLHLLWRIKSLQRRSRHTDTAIELVRSASRPGFAGRSPNAALATYALKAYHGSDLRQTSDLYRETEDLIETSLQAGEETFVRVVDLDPLLHHLFPEMSDYLATSSATPQVVSEVRARRVAAETKAWNSAQLRARRQRIVSEGRAKKAAQALRAEIDAEIAYFTSRTRWARNHLNADDAARLYEQFGGQVKLTSVKPSLAITRALQFKAQGQSIKQLIETLGVNSASEVRKVMQLLQEAGICLIG